jgi:hypothetical protein
MRQPPLWWVFGLKNITVWNQKSTLFSKGLRNRLSAEKIMTTPQIYLRGLINDSLDNR